MDLTRKLTCSLWSFFSEDFSSFTPVWSYVVAGFNYEVSASRSFDGTVMSAGMIGEAFYNGLWAYDGW